MKGYEHYEYVERNWRIALGGAFVISWLALLLLAIGPVLFVNVVLVAIIALIVSAVLGRLLAGSWPWE